MTGQRRTATSRSTMRAIPGPASGLILPATALSCPSIRTTPTIACCSICRPVSMRQSRSRFWCSSMAMAARVERTVATDFDSARANRCLGPQHGADSAAAGAGRAQFQPRQARHARRARKTCSTKRRRNLPSARGGKKDEQAFRRAPVILSAFSGGYRSVAFSLARGGLGPRASRACCCWMPFTAT